MAKKRSKKKYDNRRNSPGKTKVGKMSFGGHYPSKKKRRDNTIAAVVAIAIVGGFGTMWWQSESAERSFLSLAEIGSGVLPQVTSSRSQGQRHLAFGETIRYGDAFPTSGPHAQRWTVTGFYETPQPATGLVHALEHGNVVIYYDRPGNDALQLLQQWADLFTGQWDGVVVAPKPGVLGERVVLTAWTKKLELAQFDAASVAAFIDAFRGRGPENRVR